MFFGVVAREIGFLDIESSLGDLGLGFIFVFLTYFFLVAIFVWNCLLLLVYAQEKSMSG